MFGIAWTPYLQLPRATLVAAAVGAASFALAVACGFAASAEPIRTANQAPSPARTGAPNLQSADSRGTPEMVEPFPVPSHLLGLDLSRQSPQEAAAKSFGCVACHQNVGDPHMKQTVSLGCIDCHGGDPSTTDKHAAHVPARFPEAWLTSGNPVRSYTLLNYESPDFVRFVNPGDLRVAHLSCGTTNCHGGETLEVKKSMMTHGCMLWGSALYNNGAVPFKWSRFGESYSMNGAPQRLQTVPPPTLEEMERKGVLPYLDPLPRFQITQPGNVLRIFEPGGRFLLETGIPERKEEPGRPRARLSTRGLGTMNRTDPVFIGLAKTRLLDPTLNFLGTNDHPGDYRSSGCTACHMVYANDRSPVHSGPFAKFGNRGTAAASLDPMIPKDEPGHPIEHRFTRAIPTSQCIVCHVHPGTNVLNSYLGYMWWDEETDGRLMYPPEERDPTAEEMTRSQMFNPDEAAVRGNWSNPEFLAEIQQLNPYLEKTQFADFHGHGWVFRAVYKKNREGILVDHEGQPIPSPSNAQLQASVKFPERVKELYKRRVAEGPTDEQWFAWKDSLDAERSGIPVHMLDIHLEKGMHCVDCHFVQDVHGNAKLYGEVRAAIEITCTDCHGDVYERAFAEKTDPRFGRKYHEMRTSGPAAEERRGLDQSGQPLPQGRDLLAFRTPGGKRRFEITFDGRLLQHSMVEEGLAWEVPQVKDTITPTFGEKPNPRYNALAHLAKTVRFDQSGKMAWGDVPEKGSCKMAHDNGNISCIACHSSWNPSCYGCHLPQKANRKMPELHFEGDVTRNYVSYNFQTLRDEVYMLARDGNVTGNKIGPARSSCAVHVGSYNQNRESIYVQQQTISAEGPSGVAFSTNVPHTVRGRGETKLCGDCHLSGQNDNNAVMAQLLMQGTNYLNFIGRYCWVSAGEEGLFAVEVTERDEPQAVIGSTLHELAYPERYRKFVEEGAFLEEAHEHPGIDIGERLFRPFLEPEVLNAQMRGEWVAAAMGPAGVRIFDVAFIDNKGFSERLTTAPISPIGWRLVVRTEHCTSVTGPTTMAPDPTRVQDPLNHEPRIHPLYGYILATDKYEGLITINVATILDGVPTNNFVERETTFNPGGLLKGAKSATVVGTYAYVCCDAGIVVVSLDNPKDPRVTAVIDGAVVKNPKVVQFQFRYAFVADDEGLKVLDITELHNPRPVASLPLPECRNVYVARTYAYVSGGEHGLIIVDVKNPEQPKIDQIYDARGYINDLNDVKLGITYVSEFAYLADGENGLRVVQLTSPETPGNDGFSPRPTPRLIATFEIPKGGHALAISEGLDRDRAVDESGNQISVFGRVGARPLDYFEQRKLYLRPDGSPYKLWDLPRDFSIANPIEREQQLLERLRYTYPGYPVGPEDIAPPPPHLSPALPDLRLPPP